ncbi:MAG: helix-turn-helix transcriptional regulator [Nitrospinaceae bacterium]|nr:MAG: helix-turn-helix transcriptional regulator [Nitrospinaceae bacterium]
MSDAKQRILDSARGLIYSRSYAGVGVQEICKHAGVKKGSFYHFFPLQAGPHTCRAR